MSSLDMPERFTGTIYVSMHSDPCSCLYGLMSFSQHDPSYSSEKILLGQLDVDIPLDASGSLDRQVSQLRQAKQKIIDEATDQAGQIEEAIQSLLAIESKGPA